MVGTSIRFATSLLSWYDRARRNLPWRPPLLSPPPDPYFVLVSELMLQQTQVATVIPYFHRFVGHLPTIARLAEADEQDVLKLWQGLGYYSRARNLRRAARMVMEEFGGRLPSSVEALTKLPGVGRYTAGAIASIAFDQKAPILDGNVMRVICRLDAIEADPRTPAVQKQLWLRAAELLPDARAGDFNSSLMELGATVCTPRAPNCLLCPVSKHCQALAAGLADRIPPPRKAKVTPVERRIVLCIRRGDRWLIEQRPAKGRWAGLWQFVTRPDEPRGPAAVTPVKVRRFTPLGEVRHQLTHRSYVFDARVGISLGNEEPRIDGPFRWVRLGELSEHPVSKPQLEIAAMLARRTDGAS
ncbi:A/G-specific adenine glycosylase [Humisphaera borealis]|uniref:Adenine DNA glycosylase n=1 Tax=Humisphaera borealis TaxID=2807512 RepID=A0A7M2WXA4_9BACT|nr:A/G-specific adenine glycosylase [Humisphaera borealis]QOV89984.1 A/G-specific adenine glycosylase [Humisphaera borealis]